MRKKIFRFTFPIPFFCRKEDNPGSAKTIKTFLIKASVFSLNKDLLFFSYNLFSLSILSHGSRYGKTDLSRDKG